MLMLLKAAMLVCSMDLESDDTYFAVCEGRREGMEETVVKMTEQQGIGIFCQAYEYDTVGDAVSFVVVCQ